MPSLSRAALLTLAVGGASAKLRKGAGRSHGLREDDSPPDVKGEQRHLTPSQDASVSGEEVDDDVADLTEDEVDTALFRFKASDLVSSVGDRFQLQRSLWWYDDNYAGTPSGQLQGLNMFVDNIDDVVCNLWDFGFGVQEDQTLGGEELLAFAGDTILYQCTGYDARGGVESIPKPDAVKYMEKAGTNIAKGAYKIKTTGSIIAGVAEGIKRCKMFAQVMMTSVAALSVASFVCQAVAASDLDDVYLTVTASDDVNYAGGNALEVTYVQSDGSKHDNSLGSLDDGEVGAWREDLYDDAYLTEVVLRVDETDDICASSFVFLAGREVSGTGEKEVLTLPGYVVQGIAGLESEDDCVWFGDSPNSLTKFQFSWETALTCQTNHFVQDHLLYTKCLKDWAVTRIEGYVNGNHRAKFVKDHIQVQDGSGRCLDMHRDNMNIYVHSECHDGRNQKWYYEESTKRIRSRYNNKCIDWHLGNNNAYAGTCHSNTNQKWTYTSDGLLRSVRDKNKCLDMNKSDFNLLVYRCHGGSNQRFDFHGNDYFARNRIFESEKYANKCIDLSGNNAYHGATIKVWDCNGGTAQEWSYQEELLMLRRNTAFVIGFEGDAVRYRKLVLKSRDNLDYSQHWTLLPDGRIRNAMHPEFCIGIAGSGDGIVARGDRLELHPCSWTHLPLHWSWKTA